MPREGVPYPGGAICRLKCELKNLWQAVGTKLHSINGVEGDGAGQIKLLAGSNVTISNDTAHNEITISAAGSSGDVVKSVNGILPDQDGDVAINTGVLTVNQTAPDSDGDFTISAGSNITITPTTNGLEIESTTSGGVTPQDVQDALDAYAPMVRTSGNQLIGGNKTFQAELGVSRNWGPYGGGDNPGLKLMDTRTWNLFHNEIEFIQFAGIFGTAVSLTAKYNDDNTVSLNVKIRNSNGSMKSVELVRGDVI